MFLVFLVFHVPTFGLAPDWKWMWKESCFFNLVSPKLNLSLVELFLHLFMTEASRPGPFCCLHVLPVSVWFFSGYSGFLSQSKDMHIGLTGDSKLPLGINVGMSVRVNVVCAL